MDCAQIGGPGRQARRVRGEVRGQRPAAAQRARSGGAHDRQRGGPAAAAGRAGHQARDQQPLVLGRVDAAAGAGPLPAACMHVRVECMPACRSLQPRTNVPLAAGAAACRHSQQGRPICCMSQDMRGPCILQNGRACMEPSLAWTPATTCSGSLASRARNRKCMV